MRGSAASVRFSPRAATSHPWPRIFTPRSGIPIPAMNRDTSSASVARRMLTGLATTRGSEAVVDEGAITSMSGHQSRNEKYPHRQHNACQTSGGFPEQQRHSFPTREALAPRVLDPRNYRHAPDHAGDDRQGQGVVHVEADAVFESGAAD